MTASLRSFGLLLAGLLGLVALGTVCAFAPEATVLALLVGGAVAVVVRWPKTFLVFFAFAEPLQSLLTGPLPAVARYSDELLLLATAVAIIGPKLVREPRRFLRDPFLLLALAFCAWNGISSVTNGVPLLTASLGTFVTLDYVILLVVLPHLGLGREDARTLVRIVVGLGLVATAVGFAQHVLGPSAHLGWQDLFVEGDIIRVPSLFQHPNDFGYYMLDATLVALGVAISSRRPGMTLAFVVCLLGLLLSVSRSSYLALFFALGVGGLVANRRLLKVWLVTAILVPTVFGTLFVHGIESRLDKIQREGGDARLTYLTQSIPIIAAHPILGVGPGRFGGEVARRFGSPVHKAYGIEFASWKTVDSFWLHLLVESGAGGVLVFLTLLFVAFEAVRRRYAAGESDPYVAGLLLASCMVIAGQFLVNATSLAFEANNVAGPFWLVVGTALATSRAAETAELAAASETESASGQLVGNPLRT